MKPISEERQRKVYEWLYPDELKGEDWEVEPSIPTVAVQHVGSCRIYVANLTPLYIDGQPNYQFFFTEIVPRLKEAKVYIMYGNMGSDEWWMDAVNLPVDVITNPDPIAATAEYVEALEGR